ncbi:MAG: hypothetical protein E2O68_02630 [Deltaproteobacteria bacterium]|nr:MAG: hypothetical protein E2O68_02630 [Deltaproteobacteria bacterium]
MDKKEIETLAKDLDQARKFSCPLNQKIKPLSLDEAISVQEEGIKLRQTRGEIVTGLKIEGDSLWGYLTNQMNLVPGCKFSRAESIMPKIRPHLAIFIDCHLKGSLTPEEVLNATSGVSSALEILDSRFGETTSIEEQVCDNFSTSYYLLGKTRVDPKEVDLKNLQMTLQVDSYTAMSNSLTQDPLIAIARLCERGMEIPAGMVILTGLTLPPIDLNEGMNISLHIDSLGCLPLAII